MSRNRESASWGRGNEHTSESMGGGNPGCFGTGNEQSIGGGNPGCFGTVNEQVWEGKIQEALQWE